MATHSSILAWKIPWTEKPGGVQSIRLQSIKHDWETEHEHTGVLIVSWYWYYACVHPKSLQSCLTVTPCTIAHQAPLFMGFSRQEYWSGLPCSPPGAFPNPGIEPTSLTYPALAGEILTTSITWEVHWSYKPRRIKLVKKKLTSYD